MMHTYSNKRFPSLSGLIFLVLTGFPFKLYAQTPKIESLLQQLPGMKEDTNKVILINKLSQCFYDVFDYEKSMAYAKKAQLLSEDLNYKQGLVRSNILLGRNYRFKREYETASNHFIQVISIADQSGDKKGLVEGYLEMGATYYDKWDVTAEMKQYDLALKTAKEINDKELLNAVNNSINRNMANTYVNQGNNDAAIILLKECIVFDQNAGNREAVMDANNIIAHAYKNKNDYEQAYKYTQEVLNISTEIGDTLNMARAYYGISILDYYSGKNQEALNYCQKALQFYLAINYKNGIQSTYNLLGTIHFALQDYTEALNHYMIVLKDNEGNQARMADIYCNIARVYEAQKNYTSSLENELISLKLHEEVGAIKGWNAANINYHNVGNLYQKLGEYDKALNYAKTALKLNQEWGSPQFIYDSHILISQINEDKEDYSEAKSHLKEALQIGRELLDSSHVAIVYYYLGKCNIRSGNYEPARLYLKDAMTMAKKLGLGTYIEYIYFSLAELESLSGDPQLALATYKQYVAYSDSVNMVRYNQSEKLYKQSVAELSVKFETEKKEKEILRLENEKEINALQLRVQNESLVLIQSQRDKLNAENLYAQQQIDLLSKEKQLQLLELDNINCDIAAKQVIAEKQEAEIALLNQQGEIKNLQLTRKTQAQYYMIAGFFLFALLGLFMYAHYRTRQKLRLQILKQKIAETEKMALRAQMNPHFIFNCINSIDALIQSNDKYQATLYLNKFAKLIRNILDSSKANDMTLAKDLETLKLYIELEQFRHENKFTAEIIADPAILQGNYNVPPLIIQPYVENAIIHGLRNRPDNDGKLTVTLEKMDGYLHYTVLDNGVGRKNTVKTIQDGKKSYGMEMSSERIKLFNQEDHASVKINDLEENGYATGTRVEVLLKVA